MILFANIFESKGTKIIITWSKETFSLKNSGAVRTFFMGCMEAPTRGIVQGLQIRKKYSFHLSFSKGTAVGMKLVRAQASPHPLIYVNI